MASVLRSLLKCKHEAQCCKYGAVSINWPLDVGRRLKLFDERVDLVAGYRVGARRPGRHQLLDGVVPAVPDAVHRLVDEPSLLSYHVANELLHVYQRLDYHTERPVHLWASLPHRASTCTSQGWKKTRFSKRFLGFKVFKGFKKFFLAF